MPRSLKQICKNGQLLDLAEEYVRDCEAFEVEGKKQRGRFPNLAGFCRKLGIGVSSIKLLEGEYPDQYGALLSLFEDEALNSAQSATVLSTYMKEHLGFGEKKEGGATLPVGDIRLVFEHDILEDGK